MYDSTELQIGMQRESDQRASIADDERAEWCRGVVVR